ncbi:hypothetical protein PMIN04_002120 [Paraphaeosphaeria minitans]
MSSAPLWSLIDIQNDFINGSLNNPRAPAILPKVYKLLDDHEWPFIVASQDWHPKGHVSFASAHPGSQPGGSVQVPFVETPLKTETQSLYLRISLRTGHMGCTARKRYPVSTVGPGRLPRTRPLHQESARPQRGLVLAFADNQYHRFTTLHSELTLHTIATMALTGLITSACVRGTSIDGIKLGYEIVLIEDATESISAEARKAGGLR